MIRAMLQRWRSRRAVPPLVRHGAPRESGRGALAPQDHPCQFSGQLERTAQSGAGLVATLSVAEQQRRYMQTAQRPRETPNEVVRRANTERAWRGPW